VNSLQKYKQIKKRIIILFLLTLQLLIFNSGCERQEPVDLSEIDCSECYQDKPEWGPLNITVTINSQNPYVPLKVYIGNFEEGNLDWTDTAYSSDFRVDVKPDQYYSVTAEYKDGDKTIFAVDGDKLKIKHTSDKCDEPCYYFKGGYIDVRLRN